jgi:hypothetical protein
MVAAVREGSPERRLALIRAHPDLAGKAARDGMMTPHSVAATFPGTFERRAQDDPGAVFQEFRTVLDGLLSDPSRPLGLRTGSGSLCPERSFTP